MFTNAILFATVVAFYGFGIARSDTECGSGATGLPITEPLSLTNADESLDIELSTTSIKFTKPILDFTGNILNEYSLQKQEGDYYMFKFQYSDKMSPPTVSNNKIKQMNGLEQDGGEYYVVSFGGNTQYGQSEVYYSTSNGDPPAFCDICTETGTGTDRGASVAVAEDLSMLPSSVPNDCMEPSCCSQSQCQPEPPAPQPDPLKQLCDTLRAVLEPPATKRTIERQRRGKRSLNSILSLIERRNQKMSLNTRRKNKKHDSESESNESKDSGEKKCGKQRELECVLGEFFLYCANYYNEI